MQLNTSTPTKKSPKNHGYCHQQEWCVKKTFTSVCLVGASLSELHTSGLYCTDVCVYDQACGHTL